MLIFIILKLNTTFSECVDIGCFHTTDDEEKQYNVSLRGETRDSLIHADIDWQILQCTACRPTVATMVNQSQNGELGYSQKKKKKKSNDLHYLTCSSCLNTQCSSQDKCWHGIVKENIMFWD